MSERHTAFVLNAKTMGISSSSSPAPVRSSPSSSPTRERRGSCSNPQQQQQEQKHPKQQQQQQEKTSTALVGPTTSSLFANHNDMGRLGGAMQQVAAGSSLCPPHAQCNVATDTISTDYYRSRLNRLRDLSGDTAQMNFELNNIFVKRLEEIDCLDKQKGDATNLTPQLRLITFQEWVDLLLHVNNIMFGNMSALEEEAYEKISSYFQSIRGEQQESLEENRKLRRDICEIMKLVQNAYHKNVWNTQDMCLETLTVNHLLGVPRDQTPTESESEKVNKCMKSLVNEMAAKHDEVCHLQRQLCALDGVVQTARQKIILKDQCIAQLNQQLAEVTERLANLEKSSEDIKSQENSCSQADEQFNFGLLEGLSHQDQQESEVLKILNAELNELFNLSNQNKTSMECSKKTLACYIKKINSEYSESLKKLEFIRNQIFLLECDMDKSPLPLASSTQKPQPLQIQDNSELHVLDSLRNRLLSISNCNKELRSKCQHMDVQYAELLAKYETDNSINQRNCTILKELADLICRLRSMEFSYSDIYTESSTRNPFCAAVMDIFENNNRQEQQLKTFNQRLACEIDNLHTTLKDRDHQIKQLHDMITGFNDIHENTRLKNEIYDLKQKNCVQARVVRKMGLELKGEEEQRIELCDKYEKLLGSFEEQCKELKRANSRVNTLQERLSQVEKLQEELRTERNILREEVIALKEKDAKRNGHERALCDQLKCCRTEIEQSRTLIRNMQCHLKLEEAHHQDTVMKLEHANQDIRQQMGHIADECRQMQVKLKQQTDVNQQQYLIIESFRNWKIAQVRSDEAMRQCVKRGEDHISTLLEENQRLCEEYQKLHRDYDVLDNEMLRVKQAVNSRGSSQKLINPSEPIGNDMAKCVQDLSDTSRRIADLNDKSLHQMPWRAPGGEERMYQQQQQQGSNATIASPLWSLKDTQFSDKLPAAASK
ncbi:centrosome-associated protein CEP250 isoform X1 [Drosophila willistoni]|uniref:centrosome-associated protein CEP250 isoform X1 n=1 Tax=Drosophila willistoni TaxID=7260 RepID=UPI000C26D27D|nr:centrosome-associated protein CEP250 isoform X1 [Drosophila willistoni]